MSDPVVAPDSGIEGAGSLQTTPGEILRNARQAAGIHIEALAVALKVPVSKLEALESNNFEYLSDTVFLRALASSICRTLKLDPAPVLALLPQSKSPRLAPERPDINTPVKTATGRTFITAKSSRHSSWMMVSVLVLLAGAAVVFYWPSDFRPWDAVRSRPEADAIIAPTEPVTFPPASQSAPVPASTPAVNPEPSVVLPTPQASAQPALGPTSEPGAVSPSVAGASTASTGTADAPLVLRTRGESWVQVRDASGRVIFEKKMSLGESAPVTGAMPLSVVVGRADVTDVYVRGKPFELNSVSRENVARFEVKQ